MYNIFLYINKILKLLNILKYMLINVILLHCNSAIIPLIRVIKINIIKRFPIFIDTRYQCNIKCIA